LSEVVPLEWHGKVYHRSDMSPEPRHSSPARPYDISIKGDFDSTSGELGIVKVAVISDVERIVMFPPRGGVYNPRQVTIAPRPHYYVRNPETGHREREYKVQCTACGDYQKREAFSPDPLKRNGLKSQCKTCRAEAERNRYWESKAA